MRVLITGVSGFIGCHLGKGLAADGFELFGLAPEEPVCLPEIRSFGVDILDADTVVRTVEECAPDVVIHLAGLSHVGESWKRPGDYYRVNFLGTHNLMRAAGGRRVILASSAEVYGFVPESEQPIAEDRPLYPRSPYAMSKACAERIALDHGAIVVRSFNTVGAGQSRRFALPSFAAQLAGIAWGEREPVLRVGDLSPRRDFLHVADAVAGYRLLTEHGEPGGVYNLASGEVLSVGEVLERLRAVSGVAAEVEREASRVRPVDIPLLSGDSRRLRTLGWEPEHGLERALQDIWREARAARGEGRR